MITKDERALICDFAETYHIINYKSLPVRTAATLAAGLGTDSRIKLALAGQKLPTNTLLLAAIADKITLLAWMQTEDGHKNRNRPKSILEALTQEHEERVFDSPEDYEAARDKILEGAKWQAQT